MISYVFRSLLINGLSFECNGDGDYDTAPQHSEPVDRIRVQKNQNKEDDRNPIQPTTEIPIPSKVRTRDPANVKRVRLPTKPKAPSTVLGVSSKVSFSTKVESSNSENSSEISTTTEKLRILSSKVSLSTNVASSNNKKSSQISTTTEKLKIPKLGGERGIFAKWPAKV